MERTGGERGEAGAAGSGDGVAPPAAAALLMARGQPQGRSVAVARGAEVVARARDAQQNVRGG